MKTNNDAMLFDVGPLVGAEEIRRMLGNLSRTRVQQIVNRDDFPAPYATLAMGKVWRTEDVETWAHSRGRGVVDPGA